MKRLLHVFLMGRTKGSNLERMFRFFFPHRYLVVWFCGVNEIKREKITLHFFLFILLYFILKLQCLAYKM